MPIPAAEVDQLVSDIHEIRTLLFCRLLPSQASLLVPALRADSVSEFLQDPSVSTMDLRNVCIKLENPDLQAIRDACADYARDGEPEDDSDCEELEPEPDKDETPWADTFDKSAVPKSWKSKNELAIEQRQAQARRMKSRMLSEGQDHTDGLIDFGLEDGIQLPQERKVKIKVCGKTIWNHPSNKAMARGGWLHFSSLQRTAISLMRSNCAATGTSFSI